ncbi:hypothetical protein [Marinivivus vitaminiproducens]|uniref:hypothetical protein n=1 Tax=Marinivivus vitaminiproducens TaxID=3035935 RepID=UPI0027A98841|nr:hypothetical protein P4R82_10085 [Geminicoccaceae bacterium SCSIO 64248]
MTEQKGDEIYGLGPRETVRLSDVTPIIKVFGRCSDCGHIGPIRLWLLARDRYPDIPMTRLERERHVNWSGFVADVIGLSTGP